jgi:hypothetical protein
MGTKTSLPTTHGAVRSTLNLLIPPDTLEVFNGSSIATSDKETYYDVYNQSGSLSIPQPTNTYGVGAIFILPISTDGSSISFHSTYKLIENQYRDDSTLYFIHSRWNGNEWETRFVIADEGDYPQQQLNLRQTITNDSSTSIDIGNTTLHRSFIIDYAAERDTIFEEGNWRVLQADPSILWTGSGIDNTGGNGIGVSFEFSLDGSTVNMDVTVDNSVNDVNLIYDVKRKTI